MLKQVKFLILSFIILLLINCTQEAKHLPISGQPYTIAYESEKLTGNIDMVYVFDYWGTLYSCYAGPDNMFENVLHPDSGRVKTVKMEKINDIWQATIEIPKDVSLLSYYFTNGQEFDNNNKKTYTSYIYNKNGIPVKNARFRNIDFLQMAAEKPERIIAEAKAEVTDYPKNLVAQIVYRRKIFEKDQTFAEMNKNLELADKDYDKLVKTFGESDSLKQVKAAYCMDYMQNIYNPVRKLSSAKYEEFIKIMESIPVENHWGSMKSNYARAIENNKRGQENKVFMANLKGSTPPDFEFKTVAGKTGKLSDFKGNYTLLEFWGLGCGPCIAEIPNLKKVYEKYHEKGFDILSVCSDNIPEKEFIKFITEKESTWHQVQDKDRILNDLYKIYFVPTFILIDPSGKVIHLNNEIRGEKLGQTLQEIYQF